MTADVNKKRAVIGCGYDEIARELTKIGFELIFAERSNYFPDETAGHSDMAAFSLGNGQLVVDSGRPQLIHELKKFGYDVTETEVPACGEYPKDILLNCFTLCEKLICNEKHTASVLLDKMNRLGVQPLNVKQGYARCSSLVTGKNAVITDDSGIYNVCVSLGAHSLLVEKGDIYLSDSHCGFIGGASCMINESTAAFFGSLDTHRNGEQIKDFLKNHGVSCIELTSGALKDIGSVVFL